MQNEAEFELTYLPHQLEIFHNQTSKYVIVKKGRRSGITQGAEKSFIEFALDGITPLLWVDTINGNIERYYERYFHPDLSRLPKFVKWDWNVQKKVLKINGSIIDFRSAEQPESIEGFGYKKIFLNEAGIILEDNYLYTHAILPMLMDFPDSQLIAAGVPKGKHKKDGTEHIFYQLNQRAEANTNGFKGLHYSSYDNPILDREEIKALENEIFAMGGQLAVDQEIYGLFVEYAGENPFFTHYNPGKHESREAIYDINKQVIIVIDFNIDPFAANFYHLWQDSKGYHAHQFDELDINNGSIPALIDEIKIKCGGSLPNCKITGDKQGDKRSIEKVDNASYFIQIQRGLGLRDSQIETHANPTHSYSRGQCNYFLYNFPDFKINPEKCPNSCRDMKTVQANAWGEIIKSNRAKISQQADHADCFRYFINCDQVNTWIKNHQRFNVR